MNAQSEEQQKRESKLKDLLQQCLGIENRWLRQKVWVAGGWSKVFSWRLCSKDRLAAFAGPCPFPPSHPAGQRRRRSGERRRKGRGAKVPNHRCHGGWECYDGIRIGEFVFAEVSVFQPNLGRKFQFFVVIVFFGMGHCWPVLECILNFDVKQTKKCSLVPKNPNNSQ